MKKIVISQPFFFPWIGLFEQIRLADVYVNYDDVKFSKGSFVNRVQIKTKDGFTWLTIPQKNINSNTLIKEMLLDNKEHWQNKHILFLKNNYARAPFVEDVIEIVEDTYKQDFTTLSELNIYALKKICNYFGMPFDSKLIDISALNITGSNSNRVLDIVKALNGTKYITGRGGLNYLEHDKFDKENIKVEYMNYEKKEYSQLYGDFNPYVSILDLIANQGKKGLEFICSNAIYWKDLKDK